ncbi:MAG: outer membrane protein transport protein, partial [Odoribacteraceae bacterium]|nr:outer membrane protein transport protein [Odoribacteraceae bacterium]
SLVDVLYEQANGHARDELDKLGDPSLAYDVVLINLKENSTNEYYTPLKDGDQSGQERAITERGYQGEYAVSVGVNINDKFYVGGSIGTQIIRYKYRGEYRERIISTTSALDNFSRVGVFETNGSGVNFKIGAIFRPVHWLRLGLALHTPTYYTLSAYNESAFSSSFNTAPLPGGDFDGVKNFSNNNYSSYDYDLKTPWRFITSIAAVLDKRLIISVDYEEVDHPASDLTDTYHGEYDEIRDFFKYNARAASNIRLGTEYRANSVLSLRAGYAYHGSPYAKGDWNEKNHLQTLSAGLGFNWGGFYSDVAYLHKSATDTDYFYNYKTGNGEILASNKIKTTLRSHEFRYSIGVRF